MKNEQFIRVLRELKKEGVSFKEMAQDCNMPVTKLYHYLNCNCFPYSIRKQMEFVLLDKYKEIIE